MTIPNDQEAIKLKKAFCCNRCIRNANLWPKLPADSGSASWRCEMCGHGGIGSFMECVIGDWLVLRPLQAWNRRS